MNRQVDGELFFLDKVGKKHEHVGNKDLKCQCGLFPTERHNRKGRFRGIWLNRGEIQFMSGTVADQFIVGITSLR